MNKGNIKKGVFAIAVVAMTATVGIVGFAHAAQSPRPQADGYGTGLDAFLAALQTYQDEIKAATDQYKADVQACLGTSQTMADAQAAPAIQAAGNDLDNTVTKETDKLSKKTGNSTGAHANVNSLSKKTDAATNDTAKVMDSKSDEITQKLAPVTNAQTRGILRSCLRNARNDFLDSIRAARQEFLQAIRNAF